MRTPISRFEFPVEVSLTPASSAENGVKTVDELAAPLTKISRTAYFLVADREALRVFPRRVSICSCVINIMVSLYEEVRAALRGSDFRPRKSRGQNFLIHERVIDGIINLLDLEPNDSVLEIGPGLGFLTRRLLERAAQVWAIELDQFLAEQLRRSAWGADPKLHLIQGDFLQFAPAEFLPKMPVKLTGNLPYSIATAVLFRIFEIREQFPMLVLMLQKEVADRIVAKPGTKEFGALSVWCQIHGRVTDKLPVSPEAFFPRPRVRSMVLKFQLFSEPRVAPADFPALRNLLRAAFGQRRKTLGNALQAYFGQARGEIQSWLRSEKIDPARRGETLSVDEFIALAMASRRCAFPPAQTGC